MFRTSRQSIDRVAFVVDQFRLYFYHRDLAHGEDIARQMEEAALIFKSIDGGRSYRVRACGRIAAHARNG